MVKFPPLMANLHSAIKQIRKDAKKRMQNQAVLSELHTLWKKFSALAGTSPKEAEPLGNTLVSKWDRAVSRGIVPKGRANRKKARIANAFQKTAK